MDNLFDNMQAAFAGNQAGQTAANGMMPSASQPRGAPQLYMPAMGAIRKQIDDANGVADTLRRAGCEQCAREMTKISYDLQGVLDKLNKLQQNTMQPPSG